MLFPCDPNKNTNCKKTSCYINGGDCALTQHFEYALDNIQTTIAIHSQVKAVPLDGSIKDLKFFYKGEGREYEQQE